MLTALEQHALEVQMNTLPQINESLTKIAGQLNCVVGALEVIGSVPQEYHPKEDPQYCMDFDEWAARLDFEDRRRIMNFLWNDSVWHDTCLREEDAPWEDKSKSEPADPQPPLCGDDDDLPF